MVRALLLLYILWGFNWVVMKEANLFFPPIAFSCYRFLLGAAVLLAFSAWCRIPLPPRRYWPWIVITGILQIAVNNAAIQVGMQSLGAGLAAVVNYSMPVWMSVMAYFFLHEKLTKRKIIGIALSMLGMCVLMKVDTVGDVTGILLTAGGAAAWAAAGIIVKRQNAVMQRQGQGNDCTMIQYTTWQITAGAAALLLYMLCFEQGTIVWNTTSVACWIYSGVLASAVSFFLWNYILTHMEASKAGVASLGVPVVGVICGIVCMGETMYWHTALGMVLILAGILLIVAQGAVWQKK